MAQIINTNMASLKAQYNLSNSQRSLSQTLERLSTGLRINSAKDDAAGLAISERFGAQIKGLNQAVRNANDGISFSQTAEGALSTTGANLQRIRELAVQATSGSNTSGDRDALNNEVQALIAEVQRVALTTEFNGRSILNGSVSETFFQAGANQGQMIAVTGIDSRTSELGTQEVVSGNSWTQEQLKAQSEQAKLASGFSFGSVGINVTVRDAAGTSSASFSFASTSGALSLEEQVSSINNAIQAEIDKGGTAGKAVSDVGMRAFLRVGDDGNTSIAVAGAFAEGGNSTFAVTGGTITTGAAGSISSAQMGSTGIFTTGASNASNVELRSLDVLTRENATQAIGIIDGALNQINSMRADIGAVQTKFESAISNLTVSSNNMSAARSRIRDADFAQETAELTRVQILQQAGISVLAQANQAPQSALSLLQ